MSVTRVNEASVRISKVPTVLEELIDTTLTKFAKHYPNREVLVEIPAGKRDAGEEPLVTGMRELEEETGYRAANYTSLGCMYPTPGCCNEKV